MNKFLPTVIQKIKRAYKLQKVSLPLIEDNPDLLSLEFAKQNYQNQFSLLYSPFSEYNEIFGFFHSCLGTPNADQKIVSIIGDIIKQEKDTYTKNFNLRDLNATNASKSSFYPSKWENYEDFGLFAFEEHLPEGIDLNNANDKKKHIDRLIKIFEETKQQKRFSYILHQTWCNRFVLINQGRSRRYAACSYLAKCGHPDFNKTLSLPMQAEHLSKNAINQLNQIGKNCVISTSKKNHIKLHRLFSRYRVPLFHFRLFPERDDEIYTVIYVVASMEYLQQIDFFYQRDKYEINNTIETIKTVSAHFDNIINEKICCTFNELMSELIVSWQQK